MREITCDICGVAFYTSYGNKKTCSEACAKELNRRKVKERAELLQAQRLHEVICVVCGKQFKTTRKNKETCSTECSLKLQRQKSLEYGRKFREQKRSSAVKQEKRVRENLARINKLAQEAGMSYGEYVSQFKR